MSMLRALGRPPVGGKVAATTGKRTGALRRPARRRRALTIGTGQKGGRSAGRGSGTSSRGRSRKPKAIQAPKGTPNRVRGKASTVAPRANATTAQPSVAASLMTPQRRRPHDKGIRGYVRCSCVPSHSPVVLARTSDQSSPPPLVSACAASRSSSRSASASASASARAGPCPAVATVSPPPRALTAHGLLCSQVASPAVSPPSLPASGRMPVALGPRAGATSGTSGTSSHAGSPVVVRSTASGHTLTHRPAPLHPRPHSRSASPASSRAASTALVATDDLRDVVADIMANVDKRMDAHLANVDKRMDKRMDALVSRVEARLAHLSDAVQSLAAAMGGAVGATVPGPAVSAQPAPIAGGALSATAPVTRAPAVRRPTPALAPTHPPPPAPHIPCARAVATGCGCGGGGNGVTGRARFPCPRAAPCCYARSCHAPSSCWLLGAVCC